MKNNPSLLLIKEIVKLASPIVFVRFLYIFVGIIGMLLIAQLGKTQLAASALVTATTTTLIVIALSPFLSISIIMGKLYGENNLEEIGNVLRLAFLMSLVVGIIVALILWNFEIIFYKLNQPTELIPLVKSYLHGLAWGVIPSFIIASCQQLCFAVRRQNLVVIWGALSLIGSIFLGASFIFGYFGFPKWGFGGWSYGGSIVTWTLLFGIIFYLYKSKKFKPFKLFQWERKIEWKQLRVILKLSWPITVQFSGEFLAFGFSNIMVGWMGTNQLSVQQILTQCSILSLIIPMGISQAVSILISQKIGQKYFYQVKSICYVGAYFAVSFMTLIALVYWLTPFSIIHLYLKSNQLTNSQILNLVVTMLSITAFAQIIDAARIVLIGGLRGLEDVRLPMWVNIIILWCVAIPLAYLLAFSFDEGILGINFGFLIAFAIGTLIMLWRFNLKTKNFKLASNLSLVIETNKI